MIYDALTCDAYGIETHSTDQSAIVRVPIATVAQLSPPGGGEFGDSWACNERNNDDRRAYVLTIPSCRLGPEWDW
jgi:hypothetical protein